MGNERPGQNPGRRGVCASSGCAGAFDWQEAGEESVGLGWERRETPRKSSALQQGAEDLRTCLSLVLFEAPERPREKKRWPLNAEEGKRVRLPGTEL